MKFLKKLLLTASFLPTLCFSQSNNKYIKRGDIFYHSLRYKNAIPYYLKATESDARNKYALEQLANCFRNIKDYSDAEVWYAKLSNLPDPKPDVVLSYAEVLASNGKYKDASKWYKKYSELNPKDERGKTFSSIYNNSTGLFSDSTDWKVNYISINSSRADFSPAYFNRGLVFVSNRSPGSTSKRMFGWDNSPFTDFYWVNDTSQIQAVEPDLEDKKSKEKARILNPDDTPTTGNDSKTLGNVSEFIAEKALPGTQFSTDLNSKYHDGPISFALKESRAMMNRNGGKGKDGMNRLKLYSADYSGGQWFGIQPFEYNSNDYSIGHPALSEDGNTLYFISDMPGGLGGTDLYYCIRSISGWSKPVNLGATVNTPGNEMFPFLSGETRLYFSSTGLPGLGGLDLFYVDLEDKKPAKKPKNLGYPLNSSKDDFGIVTQNNGLSGYISSNRLGDDDIYKFTFDARKVKLRGFVFENKLSDQRGILNARIIIKTDGVIDTARSDSAGNFYASLQRNKQYSIEAFKEGYSPKFLTLSTTNAGGGEIVESTIDLNKIPVEEQVIAKTDNLTPLRELKIRNIYYGTGKSGIDRQGKSVLDNLAEFMLQNPKAEMVASSYADSRGSEKHNRALSYKRSETVKAYLIDRGLKAERIKTEHFGETRLINDCDNGAECPEEQHRLNRRTEFKVKLQDSTVSSHNLPIDSLQNDLPVRQPENATNGNLDSIYYGLNSTVVDASYSDNLDSLVATLKENPDLKIEVASFADSRGAAIYNLQLSRQRAENVKRYLKERGIEDKRIIALGFGEKGLLNDCENGTDCTEEQQRMNRRTEISIIKPQ